MALEIEKLQRELMQNPNKALKNFPERVKPAIAAALERERLHEIE